MRVITYFTVFILIAACGNEQPIDDKSVQERESSKEVRKYDYYGEEVEKTGDAIKVEELIGKMEFPEENEVEARVEGEILEVCQRRGCWFTMPYGDGKSMRVVFKEYDFFIPINASGRKAIVEGIATRDTTPVNLLQHYADDAGKSQEEIDAITEPKVEVVFEARGVLLKTPEGEEKDEL